MTPASCRRPACLGYLESHWQAVLYGDATSIPLLCDCGGSNAANRYLLKYYLQELSGTRLVWSDSELRTCQVYCSKYYPIERRFFSHVGRACSGDIFDTLENGLSI